MRGGPVLADIADAIVILLRHPLGVAVAKGEVRPRRSMVVGRIRPVVYGVWLRIAVVSVEQQEYFRRPGLGSRGQAGVGRSYSKRVSNHSGFGLLRANQRISQEEAEGAKTLVAGSGGLRVLAWPLSRRSV